MTVMRLSPYRDAVWGFKCEICGTFAQGSQDQITELDESHECDLWNIQRDEA